MSPRTLLTAGACTATALASLLVVAAGPPADAARPTCHGVPATKVGQPKANMLGTRGRDVVITNGARAYRSGGGDDLVCVTGSFKSVSVDGAGGDERVYVQTRKSSVHFDGGTGSDTFVGGDEFDSVDLFLDGDDRISTGGAADFVDLGSAPRQGRTTVSLGAGQDSLWLDTDRVRGRLDGGGDADDLTFVHKSKKDWTIDNRSGKVTADGERRFRLRGFEGFSFDFLDVPRITFLGGDGPEVVSEQDSGGRTPYFTFATGGGDDHVHVSSKASGAVDGGAGRDTVVFGVNLITGLVGISVDLAAHLAVSDYESGRDGAWTVSAVEDVDARSYPRATLRGDDADNVLRSGSGDDTLVGAGGTDTVDAGAGTDQCDAEVETGCEV